MLQILRDGAAEGPLNYFICRDLASRVIFTKQGITARQLSAKVRDRGLAYTRRRELTKNGTHIRFKQDIVSDIARLLDLDYIGSLVKAEKGHLLAIHAAVEACVAPPDTT